MADYVIEARPPSAASTLLTTAEIQEAFSIIDATAGVSQESIIAVCEIPAPPFKEDVRADYVKRAFEKMGLPSVVVDSEGNVIAKRPGRSRSPKIVISAHLDTVFPEGTDVRVKRERGRLWAPGVSDNGCGVAALLALARVFDAAGIETEGTVYLVATVGEEG
ncbi:MAG: M20/M25/M40 family metallo-hydrolase, partial [Blastocatellia bacterium]